MLLTVLWELVPRFEGIETQLLRLEASAAFRKWEYVPRFEGIETKPPVLSFRKSSVCGNTYPDLRGLKLYSIKSSVDIKT